MIRALTTLVFIGLSLVLALLLVAGLFHTHHHLTIVMSTYLGVPPGPSEILTVVAMVAPLVATYYALLYYLNEEV